MKTPPSPSPLGISTYSPPPPHPLLSPLGPPVSRPPSPNDPPPSIPAPVPLGDAMGRGCGLLPFAGAGGGLGNIPPPGGVGGGAIQSLGCLRKGRGFLDGRGHGVGVAVRAWSIGGGAYGVGQLLFLLLFLLCSGASILPQVTAQRPPHLGAQRLQGLQPGLQQWGERGEKGVTGIGSGGGGILHPSISPPIPPAHNPGLGTPTCRARSLLGLALGPSIPRSFRRRNLRK